ncbi:MAG: methyltransferase [Armatimonadetes bacterium]|nr:methyltransferase [Armatimonadota bacterium]
MASGFSEKAVQELRELLDRFEYHRTGELPAYSTRAVFPLRELERYLQYRRGENDPLWGTAFPSRYHGRFGRSHPLCLELYQLFFLHRELTPSPPLADALARLTEHGLVRRDRDRFLALVQVTSLWGRYLISSVPGRGGEGFVYLGDDSAQLGRLARRECPRGGRGRALDMCCGCGVVAITLPAGFDEVLGVDVDPLCLEYAEANLRLNGLDRIRFRPSDVWTEVDGRFQLILGNPPALFLPNQEEREMLFARGGGEYGTELFARVVEGLEAHLELGGVALLLGFAPCPGGQDLLCRRIQDLLGPALSLDYTVLESIGLADEQVPRVHRVEVRIARDGRGRRNILHRSMAERLKGFSLPFLDPESSPQAGRLR